MSSAELVDALRDRCPRAYMVLSALESVMHVSDKEFDAAFDEVEATGDGLLWEFFLAQAFALEEGTAQMGPVARKRRQEAYRTEARAVLRRALLPRHLPVRPIRPRSGRARRGRPVRATRTSRGSPTRLDPPEPEPRLARSEKGRA